MNRLKKFSAVIAAIAVCAVTLSGCDKSGNNTDNTAKKQDDSSSKIISADTVSNISINSEYFDADDLDISCDKPDAEILLNGSIAEIKGKGAEFNDKKISITKGGLYLLSGVLDDGQIYVNTKDKVHIVLNGADVTCSGSAPVFIEDADKTIITVCDNTENSFANSSDYAYENAEGNEPSAVIYSKDDLSVNGSGILNVTANHNEGITCKNDLRICGATVNVTSAGNSIKGKDSLAFLNTVINAESLADGLKSTNTEKDDKGFIAFESGEFNITAAQDAIQAETDLIVNGGTFNIRTGIENKTENTTDSTAAAPTENENRKMFGGGFGMQDGNPNKTDDSEKGLRAGRTLCINDGNITAECADDTLHSNGKCEINSGVLTLSSGDDGIHADEQIDVNGGEISIARSYEGVESTVININDGKMHINANDDGFNASDGSSDKTSDNDKSDTDNAASEDNTDSKGFKGKPGGGFGFGDVSENCKLNINGGYIYVNANGDGLDSNGSIDIKGGTTIVDGPVNDGNGALDTGTDINVSGGTLIAAGSSGMAEIPSDSSTQRSVAACFDQQQEAGSLIWLQDESGKTITAYAPSKTYSSVVISTPDITKNKSYSVYYGGKCSGASVDGVYSDGTCSDGTLLGTETADSTVTQIGTGKIGMMGMGGHGGMKPGSFGNGEMPELPDGFTPPDGFDENMTPPGGFNGGMHHGEHDDNMIPPNGFNDNMTPPDGFNGNMTPPDGFNGNMTPPDGFNGNMAPPDESDSNTAPTGFGGGKHHGEHNGNTQHHNEHDNIV